MKRVILLSLLVVIPIELLGEEKIDSKSKEQQWQLWSQWFEEALKKEREEYMEVRDKIVAQDSAIIPFLKERMEKARNRDEYVLAAVMLQRIKYKLYFKKLDDCHKRFRWLWDNRDCVDVWKYMGLFGAFGHVGGDFVILKDYPDIRQKQYLLMEYTIKKLDPVPQELYQKLYEKERPDLVRHYRWFWDGFFSNIGLYMLKHRYYVSKHLEEYFYEIIENSKEDYEIREEFILCLDEIEGERAYNVLLKLVKEPKVKAITLETMASRIYKIRDERAELKKKLLDILIETLKTEPEYQSTIVRSFSDLVSKEDDTRVLERMSKELGVDVIGEMIAVLKELKQRVEKKYFIAEIDKVLNELEKLKSVEKKEK